MALYTYFQLLGRGLWTTASVARWAILRQVPTKAPGMYEKEGLTWSWWDRVATGKIKILGSFQFAK